jgi:hypothetical protein
MKLGVAIGVLAAVSNGLAILACLLLPETRNQDLVALDSNQQAGGVVTGMPTGERAELTK